MPGIVLAKLFEQSGASNSFYGITLLPYFKYYDPNLGSAITTSGQVFIINSKEILDDVFSKILGEKREYVTYCDTDSAYVHIQSLIDKHCVGKSDKEIVDFVENFVFKVVQPELNKRLAALTKTLGVDDCMLDMKLECIGPSMIMCCHPETKILTESGEISIGDLWDSCDDSVKSIQKNISLVSYSTDQHAFLNNKSIHLMRRWFSGQLVKITTDSGNVLMVTPTHPILVRRHGLYEWIDAGEISETDQIVEYGNR
jgi:hypothetical protein